MLHILQQVGLMRLKHTRPYVSRSLADSHLYQFPKPLQFSLKKFGSMSSVPHTISFKPSKQQFTQVSFFCLHHPILYFRFSFCCSLPKQQQNITNALNLFLAVLVWLPVPLLVFLTPTITCFSPKHISKSTKPIQSIQSLQALIPNTDFRIVIKIKEYERSKHHSCKRFKLKQ